MFGNFQSSQSFSVFLVAIKYNIFIQFLHPVFAKIKLAFYCLAFKVILLYFPVVFLASEYASTFIFSQKVLQTKNSNLIRRTVLRMPLHAVIPLLQEVTEHSVHFKVVMLGVED